MAPEILGYAPFIVALLLIGFTVYISQDLKFMIEMQAAYETAFLERNRTKISEQYHEREEKSKALPLTFPQQDTISALLTLCKKSVSIWSPMHYKNRWDLRGYKPSIQVLKMRFRRIVMARRPIKVEAIRCSDRKAIIEAGDGFSGYILTVDETNEDRDVTMFKIYTKFQYGRKISQAPPSSSNVDIKVD